MCTSTASPRRQNVPVLSVHGRVCHQPAVWWTRTRRSQTAAELATDTHRQQTEGTPHALEERHCEAPRRTDRVLMARVFATGDDWSSQQHSHEGCEIRLTVFFSEHLGPSVVVCWVGASSETGLKVMVPTTRCLVSRLRWMLEFVLL